VPRGKLLGGSSSINGMVFVRGVLAHRHGGDLIG
jgi:choline dehydrogenase-like flavoprotein